MSDGYSEEFELDEEQSHECHSSIDIKHHSLRSLESEISHTDRIDVGSTSWENDDNGLYKEDSSILVERLNDNRGFDKQDDSDEDPLDFFRKRLENKSSFMEIGTLQSLQNRNNSNEDYKSLVANEENNNLKDVSPDSLNSISVVQRDFMKGENHKDILEKSKSEVDDNKSIHASSKEIFTTEWSIEDRLKNEPLSMKSFVCCSTENESTEKNNIKSVMESNGKCEDKCIQVNVNHLEHQQTLDKRETIHKKKNKDKIKMKVTKDKDFVSKEDKKFENSNIHESTSSHSTFTIPKSHIPQGKVIWSTKTPIQPLSFSQSLTSSEQLQYITPDWWRANINEESESLELSLSQKRIYHSLYKMILRFTLQDREFKSGTIQDDKSFINVTNSVSKTQSFEVKSEKKKGFNIPLRKEEHQKQLVRKDELRVSNKKKEGHNPNKKSKKTHCETSKRKDMDNLFESAYLQFVNKISKSGQNNFELHSSTKNHKIELLISKSVFQILSNEKIIEVIRDQVTKNM